MERFEKIDTKHGVAVKKGTPDVPSDDRYHVVADAIIIFSSRVESAALIEFDELREARMAVGRERLRKETERSDVLRLRTESMGQATVREARKGGRGKGGVGG